MAAFLIAVGFGVVVFIVVRQCLRRQRQERLIEEYNNQMQVQNQSRYYNLEYNPMPAPQIQQQVYNPQTTRSQFAMSQ